MTSIIPSSPADYVAGVDYITCTARRPAMMAALLSLGQELVYQEGQIGGVRKAWYFHGFAGQSAGQVSAGFKSDGVCVRASGAAARDSAAELISCADNVSRLDLQLTVRASNCTLQYAKDEYRVLNQRPRRKGGQLEHSLITSTYTGDTLYYGRRVSDQFGRLYNKSAEEKSVEDPPRWRFEVEYKRAYAKAAAARYAASNKSPGWVAGTVARWFSDRGTRPPVSDLALGAIRSDPRGTAQEAARLEWLKRSVRPAVIELAAKYGWPDMMSLLGAPMFYSERYVNETLSGPEDV